MVKLAVIFVVALVALQDSSCSIIGRLTNLEEVVEAIAQASREIEKVSHYVGNHITPIPREFEHKISEVVQDAAIFTVIESLRQSITELQAGVGDDSKQCIENAWTMAVHVTQDSKDGTDNCISGARVVVGEMTSVTEKISGKINRLLNSLVSGSELCLYDISLTDDELAVCLHAVIDPENEEINNLDSHVQQIHHDLNVAFRDGKRNLQICLQRVREDIQTKSDTIVSETKSCIEGSVAKAEPQAEHHLGFEMPRGILDFFRELKEKIEYIIHLASHLPGSIAEIPDKINEIIAHINISAVVSQLKSEVEDIIDQGGRDSEKCRTPAETKLDDLASTSEAKAGECMVETEAKVDKIQESVEARIAEAKQLLKDVNADIFNCWRDNIINPIAFTRCLEKNYPIHKQALQDLQQRVSDTLDEAKVQAGALIEDFAACMNAVQLNLIKQGQVIIAETEECVRNALN